MKIIISESQYNKLVSYNTPEVNSLINEVTGKKLEPLSEGWLNALGNILGIFDPTGIIDIANALSYWSQGRKLFSLLSLISAIPGADFITKPFMMGGRVIAGASRAPIIGTLLRTFDTWGGKALNKLDKFALSKIPVIKNFATGMRTFIGGMKTSSLKGLKESTETEAIGISDFDVAYKECYPKIFKHICLNYAKEDYEVAQDFCQDGFIKAYQKREQFSGKNPCAWISQVVRNNILDELRKIKRQGFKKNIETIGIGTYDVPDDEIGSELYSSKYSEADIKAAVDSLSPKYRDVFIKYYVEGLQHDEVADELGINIGTSKSNAFKARNKVLDYLKSLKRD